jgi:hypothetical protein
VDANPGTHFNGPTPVAGKVAGALNIDGIDDYVGISPSSNLAFPNDFTFDAWVNNTELFGGDFIISFRPTAGFPLEGLLTENNALRFFIDGVIVATGGTLSTNMFHHVAVSRSGSTVTLYLDGISVITGTSSGIVGDSAEPVFFGIENDVSAGNNWVGAIDEIEFFNRALSGTEIQAIYNAGSDGKCKVFDPVTLIANLVSDVLLLNFVQGIENSLDAKLDSATTVLDDMNENNDVAACNSIQAFINAVEAQAGNKIDQTDADFLVSNAAIILETLGCL